MHCKFIEVRHMRWVGRAGGRTLGFLNRSESAAGKRARGGGGWAAASHTLPEM